MCLYILTYFSRKLLLLLQSRNAHLFSFPTRQLADTHTHTHIHLNLGFQFDDLYMFLRQIWERNMKMNSVSKWVLFIFLSVSVGCGLVQCRVTYDRKAIVINGQRRILISGSIHYPRSTPEVLNLFILFFKREICLFTCFFLKNLTSFCQWNVVSFRCGKIW